MSGVKSLLKEFASACANADEAKKTKIQKRASEIFRAEIEEKAYSHNGQVLFFVDGECAAEYRPNSDTYWSTPKAVKYLDMGQ